MFLVLPCASKANLTWRHSAKLQPFHTSQLRPRAATTVATTWEAAPAPALVLTTATAVQTTLVRNK